MVNLSVYTGPVAADEPHILSFTELAPKVKRLRRFHAAHTSAVRARNELRNRVCPNCSRVTVEPVELHDGLLDKNGGFIPGSATLVGFSCNACGHEWPSR